MKNYIMTGFSSSVIRLSLCWAICAVVWSVEAQEELPEDGAASPTVTVEKTPNENAEQSPMDPVEKEKIPTSENPKYKDLELTYLFGTPEPTGNDLTATFYFMKRRGGTVRNNELKAYYRTLKEFVEGGWDTSVFDDYYHSPLKLYAQCIAIPRVSRPIVPFSFGVTDYFKYDSCWAVHYQGKLMHEDGITFRFWGAADTVLDVGIDKKVVLAANHPWSGLDSHLIAADFFNGALPKESRHSHDSPDGEYRIWELDLVGSEWITLYPGEEYDFDAVVGGGHGGTFFATLMVEVLGEEYEENERGKVFPLFATQPLSWEVQDSILMNMNEGDFNVKNITSFFMEQRADDGALMKAPLDELSEEDRPHVATNNAPKLKVGVRGSEKTAEYQPNSWQDNSGSEHKNDPINITEATFGASVAQLDTNQVYDFDLDVEIYVLTRQCYAPTNFHLISHAQSESFRLNEQNQFRYVFAEKKKHTFFSYQINVDNNQKRDCGEALAEYLVLVRNEFGEVVDHSASSEWLYENLARLEKLPVGAWINEECIRIHPTTPEWVEEEYDQLLKSVQR